MKTKDLKILASIILTSKTIKKSEYSRIIKVLSAKELKLLVKYLIEGKVKNTVYITTSDALSKKDKTAFEQMFKEKNVVLETDPKIGLGVKVKDYDMEYDLTLDSSLRNIVRKVEEEL